MRIVFFGTDSFAAHVLDVLRQSHDVVTVVTVPDAPVGRKQVLQETAVSTLARELGIRILKPAKLKNDAELESILRDCNADIFVVAIYSKIIPPNILSLPPKGNINVHPSLLPLYRGPAPIRTPLRNGDAKTGVSIMLMDEQVDHGPLLASEEVNIESTDTNITLTDKLAKVAAPLLVEAITGYEAGTVVPKTQDHDKATFTKLVSKEGGKIDWSKTAQEIYNQWRAYQPWPGIYTTWNAKLLKITDCIPVPSGSSPTLPPLSSLPPSLSSSFPPLSSSPPSLSSSRMRGSSAALEAAQQSNVELENSLSAGHEAGLDSRLRGNDNASFGTVLPDGIVTCGQNTYLQILTLQPEGKQPMDVKSFLNGNRLFITSVLP